MGCYGLSVDSGLRSWETFCMSLEHEISVVGQAASASKPKWTKDRAGAAVAAWSAWYISGVIISEVATNHHSSYPHTIGDLGGTIFGGLAYLIMIRVMRRLP